MGTNNQIAQPIDSTPIEGGVQAASTDNNVDLAYAQLNYQHDSDLLREKNAHKEKIEDKRVNHEKAKLSKELGWLGTVFGGEHHASLNTASLLVLLLIVAGNALTVTFYLCDRDVNDKTIQLVNITWNTIVPIITLALGYMFGKNDKVGDKTSKEK